MKLAAGFLLVILPILGQGFGQLATNRDGSILYFSSPLRIKGTDQYLHSKIFTWDSANGIRLYEQRASDVPFPTQPIFVGTNFFTLVGPDVSSDGSIVAVTGIRYCHFSDVCRFDLEEYQSSIYQAGQPTITVSGSATLSRNGRYALLGSSVDHVLAPSQMLLLDLQAGQQTQYEGALLLPGAKHRVANDGTVVVQGVRGGFSLGQNGQMRNIVPSNATNPMINDAATLVFYETGVGSPRGTRLSAYSVPSGTSTDLAIETGDTPGFAASISDDGSQVAFLFGQGRQVWIIRSNGTGLRQITNLPEVVMEVALSGDASVAFAVTASNRIVRINVASAQSTDIVPPTPYTVLVSYGGIPTLVSRGATASIISSGFAADTKDASPPFPLALDGVELRVGGSPVPIAGISPNSITYPVPWDLPDSPVDIEVWASSASASPFVPGFQVAPLSPSFYSVSGSILLVAVHEDFTSLVSPASPARTGEIIHVYAKDLGPVNPAPPAGLPAPLSPLALLVPSMSCILQPDTDPNPADPVDVLFAGLAPELLNVFQVDVRLPATFRRSPSALRCHVGDPIEGYLIGGFLPVAGTP